MPDTKHYRMIFSLTFDLEEEMTQAEMETIIREALDGLDPLVIPVQMGD